MTIKTHSRFQTVVKYVQLKAFLHLGAWLGCALFTFVYHCDVIAHASGLGYSVLEYCISSTREVPSDSTRTRGQVLRPSTDIFMPPPLGAGGIMFSGCPSVRPSEAWNILFPPIHESVGPPEQRWPFYSMSVRPSVRGGFRAFAGEHMEGMAWNVTCWCILTTIRSD